MAKGFFDTQKQEVIFVFYDNLASACAQMNTKIATVVKECGGAVGSIDGWKKGATPRSDIVVKMALRLNVTTDYLLLGRTSAPELSMQFQTTKEQQILAAYKAHPELQPAIDKLLGIEEETVTVKEIARTKTMSRTVSNNPVKEVQVPKSKIQAALEDKSIKTDDDL